MSVALIVIYNHKYEKNIDIIESIYKSKFEDIYHLVPFYTGSKANVITVYESSYYFQGYIAQGFKFFFKEKYDHYFFIADDMILNPIINSANYKDIFTLNDESGFIPILHSLPMGNWPHNHKAVIYNPYKSGAEIKNEIPDIETAETKMKKYAIVNNSFTKEQVYLYRASSLKEAGKKILHSLYDRIFLSANFKELKYPLAAAYSDMCIVSKKAIHRFIHYSGVFAATKLWVELAIPTALILSEKNIITEKNITIKGKPLWDAEIEKELGIYEFDLSKLLKNFPKNYIFLHPIKLSRWKTQSI